MNVKITALPELAMDIYEGQKRTYPGGEALVFAVHAAEFTGVDVALIGNVGKDEYGSKIMDSIGYRRIDISGVRTEKKGDTAVRMLYKEAEGYNTREDSYRPGVGEKFKLSKSDIKNISFSDCVYITYSAPCFAEVMELKKEYGFKLAVDCGQVSDAAQLEEIGQQADFILMEGNEELVSALKALSGKYQAFFSVNLTDGGSVTLIKGEEHRMEAVQPDEYVDPTGSVNSYKAAFVCSYLVDKDVDRAMKQAANLAALTMEHYGSF